MKLKNFLPAIALSSLFILNSAQGINTHFGDTDEDLYFQNNVLLESTTSDTPGSASVTIGGTGSLTVASAVGRTKGFPRMSILGGTTISSQRNFEEGIVKTTWAGQLSAPANSVKPSIFNIDLPAGEGTYGKEVLESFIFGLSNESFSFSPAATVVLPASQAKDNQKLFIAYEENGNWSLSEEDFCVVKNQLCSIEISSVTRLALIQKQYEKCPISKLSNGDAGTEPLCILTCNTGYTLDEETSVCEANSEDDEGNQETDSLLSSPLDNEEDFEDSIQDIFSEHETTQDNNSFRHGYFKYRGSKEINDRYLDPNIVDEDSVAQVRRLNAGYHYKNPKSTESQVNKDNDDQEDNTNLLNYMLQMRNYFASNDNNNTSNATGNQEEDQTSETLQSSPSKLLPTSGPGYFFLIALVGLILMLMGFKRN